MSRYEKYKDSGIAWIGEIPEHWVCGTVGKFCKLGRGRVISNTEIGENLGKYPVYSSQTSNNGVMGYINSYDFEGDYVTWTTDGANAGTVFIRNGKFNCTNVCGTMQPKNANEIHLSILPYILNLGTKYSVRLDINPKLMNGMMAKISIALAPLAEQEVIAEFLDRKCGEIDELVALQETMIGELVAYKQSVITEAVTRGLNPNAPLRDSGIEWIGSIPQHWGNCKIQYIATLKSGYNLTTEDISDTGLYPVFGGNGVRGYYSSYFLSGEFALIGRQGALCGNINYSYGDFWATEHAVVCYPKRQFVTKWFGELLRTMNLNQYSLASAQPGLAVERIKQLQMPLPPLHEQQAIADHLDRKCEEIDQLIAIKREKIEQLKEYKKSVIFEYVTGKKRVQ